MYKSTARGEQFHNRAGSESTKGSRKGYSILGGGTDPVAELTPEQIRNNKVTRLKWLRLMLNTTGLTTAEANEKRQLEKEFKAIQKEIKAKKPVDLSRQFMNICEEIMPREQFHKILEMARDKHNRQLMQENNKGK